MFNFIYILKIIAMLLITNAHYENIYPISIIANGGLLGDVIFFAVSGFCLYNIKDSFVEWYKKRILRIYPTVWIATFICVLGGYFNFDFTFNNFISLFIYPTQYHFISSIIVLYIIYYSIIFVVNKVSSKKEKGIKISIFAICAIYLIYYILFFDKTIYHIDSVYEYNIRFLFLLSMLIGAFYRVSKDRCINNFKIMNFVILICGLFFYFISKILFSKYSYFLELQIINQIIILFVMCMCIKCVMSLEDKLNNLSDNLKKVIKYLASLTLEVYLIQYVIIENFNVGIFPLNFLIVSTVILLSAMIINIFINFLRNRYQYKKIGGDK